MNTELLLSDAAHFRVEYEINPYMDTGLQPDRHAAIAEHEAIVRAHEAAGRRVRRIAAAWECPDMVYTANAAIVRGSRAVLGDPPPERKAEIPSCHPPALDESSRRRLQGLRTERGIDLIDVSAAEAARFALNLISDGSTVTMTSGAPRLAAALRARGVTVVELDTAELHKDGGGVRCTALTLDTPARRQAVR